MMDRRLFIKAGSVAGTALVHNKIADKFSWLNLQSGGDDSQPAAIAFHTSDSNYQQVYNKALSILEANTVLVPGYDKQVLTEGSVYYGAWLECAPLEGLVYSLIRPEIALNNHTAFFELQREDGQFPALYRVKNGKNEVGFGQIQMVVPIAATAWELAQQNGNEAFLNQAYNACAKWDAWLRKYRNTRNTGLCEGFCTYDTGHDLSPRWKGFPVQCPGAEARNLPNVPSLPRLSPDLSATVYGGRIALAEMAKALGKHRDADKWLTDAEEMKSLIMKKLYSAEDGAFYDLDAQDKFVHIRGDLITRVLGEHVVDQAVFENIYQKQIHNPKAFWGEYPLASIAMDDPTFVRPLVKGSWGGPAQALTALRAGRWMDHYHKSGDFAYMIQKWIEAFLRDPRFCAQLDPADGAFTSDLGDYSPSALVFMDYTWRNAGVRKTKDLLEWSCNPIAQNQMSTFKLTLPSNNDAQMNYANGKCSATINGREIFNSTGLFRMVTDLRGKPQKLVSISDKPQHGTYVMTGTQKRFKLLPNQFIML